jgi:hypothetical protein
MYRPSADPELRKWVQCLAIPIAVPETSSNRTTGSDVRLDKRQRRWLSTELRPLAAGIAGAVAFAR